MRLAVVCGDGLPVSGLLTTFRNAILPAISAGLVSAPIAIDLGYSWRPDKGSFFPFGPDDARYPVWLNVARNCHVPDNAVAFGRRLDRVRELVANAEALGPEESDDLECEIESLVQHFLRHFSEFLALVQPDWVIAINMTLSDAVPATVALRRAASHYWRDERPGGLLFWDHDLFGSYAVRSDNARVYPRRPNTFTPLPGESFEHWVVVSQALADECEGYPTSLKPAVVPNVLPALPDRSLDSRHRKVLEQLGLTADTPVILAPVRVFEVKGVEICLHLLAAVRESSVKRGAVPPALLVFGSLKEDPTYAEGLLRLVSELGLACAVKFLDGVPLSSFEDDSGNWRLDEIDLLRIAAATRGGIFFTPNTPDVESVGLGPALAAVARVPCATTFYNAFHEIYGADFWHVNVTYDGLANAAERFVELLVHSRDAPESLDSVVSRNLEIVKARFPSEPWMELLSHMQLAALDRSATVGQ